MIETRQRLLEATRNVLGRKGLAGTTSRDITGSAGVNLAAITYHFGSKDELVAAALLQSVREWLAPTLEVLQGPGDPALRTGLAIRTLVATFDRHRAEAPVYLEALLQASRLPALHRGLLDLWAGLRRLLADQMATLIDAGSLPGWVAPQPMAALLVAVANGLVIQVTIDPDGPGLDAMAAQFGALLIAAREGV
ncbi:MAG: TetR/AcrR family transcriptional regulator [Acidimicrobiales bacterium]